MINNDILRRVSKMFDMSDDKIRSVFALTQCEISAEQLADFFKEKNDASYQALQDCDLACFLNGFIIEKRGKKDGPQQPSEQQLTNNLIFNKLKIASALKAEDVIAILALAEFSITKYELSSFFRNVNHKHYKDCSDLVLSAFLRGLTVKLAE